VSATPKPVRVRVRMYQVGFGDSFLVTVEYADPGPDGRAERHILFDLGSTRKPREGTTTIPDIADLIAQHTNGHLDVLVVTHRHKDHLLGFGDPTGSATLRDLAPTHVLRPWTEDPEPACGRHRAEHRRNRRIAALPRPSYRCSAGREAHRRSADE
jgi:glyoxylase-like metal-dependent hydrolase (beta-lactamase superfamily II)